MANEFEDIFEGVIRDLYRQASKAEAREPREFPNYLEAPDGTFLGKLTANRFDPLSIFNTFGTFGSQFSTESIFNKFGPYGSEFSNTSPYNQFATEPPFIFLNHQVDGRLTKNQFLPGAKDPDSFLEMIQREPRFTY